MARVKQAARRYTRGKDPLKQLLATKVKRESACTSGGVMRPHRHRPGIIALREIRKYQKTCGSLIEKTAFLRLVREISGNIKIGLRLQSGAVLTLQEATEAYLIEIFDHCNLLTIHVKRAAITPEDKRLALKIRCERP